MKEQLKRTNGLLSLCLRATMAVSLCAVLLTAQSGGITTKDPKAKEAVDAALKALGGADKIDNIKSLIIKGTGTNGVFGVPIQGNLVIGELLPMVVTGTEKFDFEIRMMLPDNFIEINRFPDRTTYLGISRGTLLSDLSGNGNIQQKPIRSTVNEQIDIWSRFLVGTLMKAGPTQLTLSSGGSSNWFTMTNTDGDMHEIEFESKTGYPSLIRSERLHTTGVALASIGGVRTSKALLEERIQFSNRFSTDGIMFPRIITALVPARVDKEWRIEEVRINTGLSLKDFELPNNSTSPTNR